MTWKNESKRHAMAAKGISSNDEIYHAAKQYTEVSKEQEEIIRIAQKMLKQNLTPGDAYSTNDYHVWLEDVSEEMMGDYKYTNTAEFHVQNRKNNKKFMLDASITPDGTDWTFKGD